MTLIQKVFIKKIPQKIYYNFHDNELIVYRFSYDGEIFVIAISSELTIYSNQKIIVKYQMPKISFNRKTNIQPILTSTLDKPITQ